MATMQPKTEFEKQQKKLSQEVIDIVIKRSGVSKNTIHEAAEKKFFVDNIDLLTATERRRYASVIL